MRAPASDGHVRTTETSLRVVEALLRLEAARVEALADEVTRSTSRRAPSTGTCRRFGATATW